MFAYLTQKSGGWAYLHHGAMAADALDALGWAETEIANIPGYANEVDDPINGLPHPGSSNHRVEKYQRVFESYGGENCSFMGAEKWASGFAELAKIAYASGDLELGKKNLGYAIHYIQDALCPPHIFPFSEKLADTAHWNFEANALSLYGTAGNDWQALVRDVPAELITSTEDLRQKVEEAADWMNASFQPPRCSYVRQDGAVIGDLSGTVVGWNMSDEDIGKCIERAASLVKGAARWAHPHAKYGIIYIRADGSIDPPMASISSIDNVTYNVADSIATYGIVIERDNVIVDGNGHTIQGTFDPMSNRGMDLSFRSNVTIKNTKVVGFWQSGIYLWYSSHICIFGSSMTANSYGGLIGYESNCSSIYENNIENNSYGIYLYGHHYLNRIFRNNITANRAHGIGLDFGSGIGSLNNDIYGNNITANYGNVSVGFYGGIFLRGYSNNSIYENNIENNWCGIYLYTGSNNTIYNNNFRNNIQQIRDANSDYPNIPPSINAWDYGYPSGGNYWSGYTGVDSDPDGIGDTEYIIGAGNIDHYPLMGMFHSFNTFLSCSVDVVSNSTVESFEYSASNSEIRMYVSNMTVNQTFGFCRVRIPHALMNETYHVTINGAEPYHGNYTLYDDGNNRWIYFSYQHSTLEIIIVPEFPSFLILPLFIITTLLALIASRKKRTGIT